MSVLDNNGNQKYKELFVDIGSRLETMKNKQMIRMDLVKLSKESQYYEEKIKNIRQKISLSLSEIALLKQKIDRPEKELQALSFEKDQLEKDRIALEELETKMSEKLAILPEIKYRMKMLQKGFDESKQSHYQLKKTFDDLEAENNSIEKKVHDNKSKMDDLTQENLVMKSTLELLKGILPDNFDQETFDEVQGKQAETLHLYIEDMKLNIKSITTEIEKAIQKTDEMKTQIEPLKQTITKNQSQISEITKVLGNITNIDEISKRCDYLRQEIHSLPQKTQQLIKENKAFENKSAEIDQRIVRNKRLDSEYSEKMDYLNKRKQQMDEMKDIDAEVQRIQEDTVKDQQQKALYNRLNQLSSSILNDLMDVKDQMNSQKINYTTILDQGRSAL